ncbi:proline racemase family protein [Algivirga pacifica]|uniref:Proline racemase family protein n=1 Tax=Algivirga pacifica TaxID=1162670 RepID=A0ABP9D8W1_9BACT
MSIYHKIQTQTSFVPPEGWLQVQSIDMHTGGEPLRVIIGGLPKLEGNNILEYRQDMKNRHDSLRKALMWEPRGHADMYGCVLLPPNTDEADFGVLFIHNEGYSTMCGHAVIALTKLAVEMGWKEKTFPETHLRIDAPCGRIDSYARLDDHGKVTDCYFYCVPSFTLALNQEVQVKGIGNVPYDISYGGAFYAYVDADHLGISMAEENHNELIEKGRAIKHAVMEQVKVKHPFEEDLSFLYGTIFMGKPEDSSTANSRNVCIFADGEVDRSPTGSGVAGRMALHYAKGELSESESLTIESITGSQFKGSIKEVIPYGPYQNAVIPKVEGTAYITGMHTFLIDPDDPFKEGFLLR